MARLLVSDELWSIIEPHIPVREEKGDGKKKGMSTFIRSTKDQTRNSAAEAKRGHVIEGDLIQGRTPVFFSGRFNKVECPLCFSGLNVLSPFSVSFPCFDMLTVIEEKTKNNLSKEESDMLATTLYELRNRYVQLTMSQRPTA